MAKFYNEKIQKFIEWADQNKWWIISDSLFELYRCENPEVEPLTKEELKYLKLYSELRLQNLHANGTIKQDAAKLTLLNKFGWTTESTKQEINQNVEYVKIDTSGLLKDNPFAHQYDDYNFENKSAKKLLEEQNHKN